MGHGGQGAPTIGARPGLPRAHNTPPPLAAGWTGLPGGGHSLGQAGAQGLAGSPPTETPKPAPIAGYLKPQPSCWDEQEPHETS